MHMHFYSTAFSVQTILENLIATLILLLLINKTIDLQAHGDFWDNLVFILILLWLLIYILYLYIQMYNLLFILLILQNIFFHLLLALQSIYRQHHPTTSLAIASSIFGCMGVINMWYKSSINVYQIYVIVLAIYTLFKSYKSKKMLESYQTQFNDYLEINSNIKLYLQTHLRLVFYTGLGTGLFVISQGISLIGNEGMGQGRQIISRVGLLCIRLCIYLGIPILITIFIYQKV